MQTHSHHFPGPAIRYALAVFITVRVVLTVFAAVVVLVYPRWGNDPPPDVSSPESAPVPLSWKGILLDSWQRFDARIYVRIAAEGYGHDGEFGDTAFAPLYPALIRILGRVLGERYSLAALLISNAAAFAALWLLFQLVEFELDRSTARRATLYLATFPVSFFLFAAYSESLYLALSIAAFYFLRRSRWGYAGPMALLASLTRTPGWLLGIPFLLEYIRPRQGTKPPRAALLSVAAAPLGLGSFLLYRRLAGYPSMGVLYATYWRSRFVAPWLSILAASNHILSGSAIPADVFDLFLAFAFTALVLIGWRRIPSVYSLYVVAGILFSLTRLKVPLYPLQSLSRYLFVLFPVFMILAQLGENRWTNRVVLYSSFALLLFWTGQFVLGGWVA